MLSLAQFYLCYLCFDALRLFKLADMMPGNFSCTRIARVAGYNNSAQLAGDSRNTCYMLYSGSVKAFLQSTTCTVCSPLMLNNNMAVCSPLMLNNNMAVCSPLLLNNNMAHKKYFDKKWTSRECSKRGRSSGSDVYRCTS